MEALTAPSNFGDLDESAPKSSGCFMNTISREMDEDLGNDFDETLEIAHGEETKSPMFGES